MKLLRTALLIGSCLCGVARAGGPVTGTISDVPVPAQSLSLTTVGNTITIATGSGQSTLNFGVSGLTAGGATLQIRAQNNGTTGPTSILALGVGGVPTASLTADGNYAVPVAGHTQVQLVVAAAGTGSATVAGDLSVGVRAVALIAPVPPPPGVAVTATQPALSTSDVVLLPANPTRKGMEVYLSGTGSCTMNLGFGVAAVSGAGLTYGANTPGQSWFASGSIPNQAIHAISNTASGCIALVREYN